MRDMTPLKHLSLFIKPMFSYSTLVKSMCVPLQELLNAKLNPPFRQNLGLVSTEVQEKTSSVVKLPEKKVRLSSVINISDFEYAASQNLPQAAFACESFATGTSSSKSNFVGVLKTGAEDEHAVRWNKDSWKMIRFRPRVLRPIGELDLTQSILGTRFAAPFFICPAGGAKLAHSDADLCLTRAAARHGILHWVCNNGYISQKDMAETRAPGQTQFWQIYAMSNLDITTQQVKEAIKQGYKGFALTVDAIRAGKRESDLRVSLAHSERAGKDDDDDDEDFAGEPSVKRP